MSPRRLLRLARLALFAPVERIGDADMAPETVLQLADGWRSVGPLRPLAREAVVTFGISLIGRDRARDWQKVCTDLDATLANLRSQSSRRWQVLICSQDRPASLPVDPRITFIKFPHPVPDGRKRMTDRPEKIAFMVEYLAAQQLDGYFMSFDADDFLHPDFVRFALWRRDPNGYILTDGYMLDGESGDLAYMREEPASDQPASMFFRHCGSCAAIRADFRDSSRFVVPLTNRGKHNEQHNALAAYGIPLARVPFAAGIYYVNHSESLRERRGKRRGRPKYIDRHSVPQYEAMRIRRDFGLAAPQ